MCRFGISGDPKQTGISKGLSGVAIGGEKNASAGGCEDRAIRAFSELVISTDLPRGNRRIMLSGFV